VDARRMPQPPVPTLRCLRHGLTNLFDDADELLEPVAVPAGEVDEVRCLGDDGAALWGAGNGDAAAAAEVEQALVAQLAECAQHGVGVDAKHGREIARRWQSFAGVGFPVGDGTADLSGDLLVQLRGIASVHLDT
jgi:hypothetical protein